MYLGCVFALFPYQCPILDCLNYHACETYKLDARMRRGAYRLLVQTLWPLTCVNQSAFGMGAQRYRRDEILEPR